MHEVMCGSHRGPDYTWVLGDDEWGQESERKDFVIYSCSPRKRKKVWKACGGRSKLVDKVTFCTSCILKKPWFK
jgi:hypothetical protein